MPLASAVGGPAEQLAAAFDALTVSAAPTAGRHDGDAREAEAESDNGNRLPALVKAAGNNVPASAAALRAYAKLEKEGGHGAPTPLSELLTIAGSGDGAAKYIVMLQLAVRDTGRIFHVTLDYQAGQTGDKVKEYLPLLGASAGVAYGKVKSCVVGTGHELVTVVAHPVGLPKGCPLMNGDASHVTLRCVNPPNLPHKQRWRKLWPKDSRALLELADGAPSKRFPPSGVSTVASYDEWVRRQSGDVVKLAKRGTVVMRVVQDEKANQAAAATA